MACSSCGGVLTEEAREQWRRQKRTNKALEVESIRRRGVPWEIWVVLAMISVDVIYGTFNVRDTAGLVALGGAVVKALVLFKGLLPRTEWGWWTAIGLFVVSAIIWFVLFAQSSGNLQRPGPKAYLVVGLVCSFAVMLLVLCRVRGAYRQLPS